MSNTNPVALADKEMMYELTSGEAFKLTMPVVKEYLVTGNKDLITDQELLFFMHTCKALKLNPFLRECYLIKYSRSENAQIITSIHHLRDLAMSHSACEGWSKGLIIWDSQKNEEIRTKGIMPPGDHYTLIGAWFSATPKGWNMPYELEINLSGYVKKTNQGEITAFWKPEKQPTQLMKVVESQGLRALFGEKTKNMFVREEMPEPPAPGAPGAPTPAGPTIEAEPAAGTEIYAATKETPAGDNTAAEPAGKSDDLAPENVNKETGEIKDDDAIDAEFTVDAADQEAAMKIWHSSNWIRMRSGDGVKTGFGVFVKNNLDTFAFLPANNQAEIQEKWKRCYPHSEFPPIPAPQMSSEGKTDEELPLTTAEILKGDLMTDQEKADHCIAEIRKRENITSLASWYEVHSAGLRNLPEALFNEVARVYKDRKELLTPPPPEKEKAKDPHIKEEQLDSQVDCPDNKGKVWKLAFCETECKSRAGCPAFDD